MKVVFIVGIVLLVVVEGFRAKPHQRTALSFLRMVKSDDNGIEESQEINDIISKFENGEMDLNNFKQKVEAKNASLKAKKEAERLFQVIASGVGVGLFGELVGITLQLVLMDELSQYDLPVYAIPVATSVIFGGGTIALGLQNNQVGDFIVNTVGKIIYMYIKNSKQTVQGAIDSKIAEIKAIPSNIMKSIERKVDETVEDIKNFPTTVANSAVEAAKGAQEATIKAVEDTADSIVKEIQATPGRTAAAIEKKASEVATEIVTAPGKAVNSIIASAERKVKYTQAEVVKSIEGVIPLPKATPKPKGKPVVVAPQTARAAPTPVAVAPDPDVKKSPADVKTATLASIVKKGSVPLVGKTKPKVATTAKVPSVSSAASSVARKPKSASIPFSLFGGASQNAPNNKPAPTSTPSAGVTKAEAQTQTVKTKLKPKPTSRPKWKSDIKPSNRLFSFGTPSTKPKMKTKAVVKTLKTPPSSPPASMAMKGNAKVKATLSATPDAPIVTKKSRGLFGSFSKAKIEKKAIEPVITENSMAAPTATVASKPKKSSAMFSFGRASKTITSIKPSKSTFTSTAAPVPVPVPTISVSTNKKPNINLKKTMRVGTSRAKATNESKPKATSTLASLSVVSKPAASATPVAASVLSKAAQKEASKYNMVTEADSALQQYMSGKIGPDGVISLLSKKATKDDYMEVLPYMVGSLPRGDKKSALNAIYQSL
jgi:hypothetical protein